MRPARPLAANNKTLRFAERQLLAHLPGPAAWVGHHHFARSKCVPANKGRHTTTRGRSPTSIWDMNWRAKISSIKKKKHDLDFSDFMSLSSMKSSNLVLLHENLGI